MIIRKLFKFEGAHVVRNCSSNRCKYSIHGHSYKIEVLLSADALDKGHMVYDFGLLKGVVKTLIDSFDHATTIWSKDNQDYLEMVMEHSDRWVEIPVSPSAEQYARLFFAIVHQVLRCTEFANGESDVRVDSVICHETDTGYAQAFYQDVFGGNIPQIDLREIKFSTEVQAEWSPDERLAILTILNSFPGSTKVLLQKTPEIQVVE